MAMVTFVNTNAITVRCVTKRSWCLPVSGEIGKASFFLPYTSPAANDIYLNSTGGSLITIISENGCGDWRGIVTGLDYQPEGVNITALHPIAILKHRPVSFAGFINNVAASQIVNRALGDAMGGLGGYPLSMGEVAETPPNVTTFLFHGEYVWDVLQQMSDLSGGEISLRTYSVNTITKGRGTFTYTETTQRNDVVAWGPALSYAYPTILLAPGQIRRVKYTLDVEEQAAQSVAINAGHWYTAQNAWSAGESRWPAISVTKEKIDNVFNLRSRADVDMANRQNPLNAISGMVSTAYFDLREGDIARIMIPYAKFTGDLVVARIMSREIDDANGLMTINGAIANEHADSQERINTRKTWRGSFWSRNLQPHMLNRRGIRYRYE